MQLISRYFERIRNTMFWASGSTSQSRGSKLHAKTIMQHVGVPTAEFIILDSGSDIESALESYQSNLG